MGDAGADCAAAEFESTDIGLEEEDEEFAELDEAADLESGCMFAEGGKLAALAEDDLLEAL